MRIGNGVMILSSISRISKCLWAGFQIVGVRQQAEMIADSDREARRTCVTATGQFSTRSRGRKNTA